MTTNHRYLRLRHFLSVRIALAHTAADRRSRLGGFGSCFAGCKGCRLVASMGFHHRAVGHMDFRLAVRKDFADRIRRPDFRGSRIPEGQIG